MSTLKNWRRADAEFAEKLESARAEAADTLELEARRRAVDGVERPVFHKGEIVGHTREYSDSLLAMLLRGSNPAKYGNRSSDVNVYSQTNIHNQRNEPGSPQVEVGPERQAMLKRLRSIIWEACPESRYPDAIGGKGVADPAPDRAANPA
ncbi:MAG: hypothetical protein H6819_06140 [Phycisphaerales bacterium]|nr:hypothetical protein [Phycisphaerales bacterium]MCB9858600.1 hypothetical protein [Phycisphaerales bacterium]